MKVSVYIATSLDGFIARENGDLDWLPVPDTDGAGDISDEELAKSAKTALGNLNLQLAVLKNLWDQAQIAKKQLEEIIGISDMDLL